MIFAIFFKQEKNFGSMVLINKKKKEKLMRKKLKLVLFKSFFSKMSSSSKFLTNFSDENHRLDSHFHLQKKWGNYLALY